MHEGGKIVLMFVRISRRFLGPIFIGFLFLAGPANYVDNPRRLLHEADRLAMLSNFPEAAPLFREAEMLSKLSGDNEAALLAHLGYLWAMAETGRMLNGDVEADRIFESTVVENDAPVMLRSLVTKAARERVINEASARPLWEKIRAMAKTVGDARWQARAQAELGEIAYLEGDVKTAVRMLKEAILSLILHHDVGAVIYYASIVGNGLVEAGQPESGLVYCNGVIRMARLFSGAGFPFLAYQGKARALIALHRFGEADGVVQTAIAMARIEENYAAQAQLLIVAGSGARDPKTAIEYLKAANALSERQGFEHAFAWSSEELAKAYRNTGDLTAAEAFASRGLVAMRGLDDRYHLPQHLALAADLNARTGKFGAAGQLYEQAADVIDGVLVNAPSRQIQSSLISTLSDVYLGYFTLAAGKLNDVHKAYEVIERARGRSLADSLRDQKATFRSTDPVTVSAQKQINSIQLSLLREVEPKRRQELLEQLFETEQRFTPIGKPLGGFRTALGLVRPVSLSDLQRRIHPDEMVLEYVLDEPRSFCFRITRAAADIVVLPAGRNAVEHSIDVYVAAIVGGKPSVEAGRWLYDALFRPTISRKHTSKLVVVPDGKLNFLPFDSLLDDNGRPILESHAVSYCPSGTVLFLMRSGGADPSGRMRFLGIGDVQYPVWGGRPPSKVPSSVSELSGFWGLRGGEFEALPSTRGEVIAASRALGWENTLLLGRDATEARLKSQPLANYDIIHFATHGVPSIEFPDRSALLLGSDGFSGEDGLLQAREIRDLPIRAKLVVLSACDTGVGSLQGQEGIANLERAFLYAGAKSVVASLWMANDVYTAHLMALFYGHLAKGEDRSVALQHAKLDSLRRLESSATPFYWAGFIIVGDGSSPVAAVLKLADDPRSSR